MLYIIFGEPRVGKTSFMVSQLNERAFDYARNKSMQNALATKNARGFKLSVPEHCVSANFELQFRKQGYKPRWARFINPFKLGFANDEVKTHFLLPFETIGIMEAQKYFNSRAFKNFRDWQSRLYEQHGHLKLDIFMDTQRAGLIDLNIRELAHFIEIIELKVKNDKNGRFLSATWTLRTFDNLWLVEKYNQSGKTDKSCYTQTKYTTNINVFELYDSYSSEPKFFEGHFDEDFDLNYSEFKGNSKEDYIEHLKRYNDEMPDELKPKKPKNKKEDETK